jgi:enoyl-CoA hydratase
LPRLIGLSRALDLILTGRPVGAPEALSMGLVNRVVPRKTARQAAEEIARGIAAFPQVCMRNDRIGAYDSMGTTIEAALDREFELGVETLASGEGIDGARRFAAGAGRGGRLD